MLFPRRSFSESPAVETAQLRAAMRLHESEDAAERPRWGVLAAAILAALVTATWVGNAFSTAQTTSQSASAQPRGK